MATVTEPGTGPDRPPEIDPSMILTQWFGAGYPVGAFAYSHGLETLAAETALTPAMLQDWMTGMLTHGAGRSDAILVAAAHRGDDLAGLDELARALAPSAERLLETEAQGAAFVKTTNAVWDLALPPLTYPVAVGAAAAALGLPVTATIRHYLMAQSSALVAAAQRLAPIGQTDAQQVVAALAAAQTHLAAQAARLTPDDIGGAAFAADILSMRHETLGSRIFRS